MELGLHIADFTWNGGVPALGPTLARHARNAEAAGITRITVMDHFWQIRGGGAAEHEMTRAAYASTISCSAGPTPRICQKWSMTVIRVMPAASAFLACLASVWPSAGTPPFQVKSAMCRPSSMRLLNRELVPV